MTRLPDVQIFWNTDTKTMLFHCCWWFLTNLGGLQRIRYFIHFHFQTKLVLEGQTRPPQVLLVRLMTLLFGNDCRCRESLKQTLICFHLSTVHRGTSLHFTYANITDVSRRILLSNCLTISSCKNFKCSNNQIAVIIDPHQSTKTSLRVSWGVENVKSDTVLWNR